MVAAAPSSLAAPRASRAACTDPRSARHSTVPPLHAAETRMSYFGRLAGSLRRVPTRIAPLALTAFTATSALGHGRAAHGAALLADRGGLKANDFTRVPLACAIGRVDALEDQPLPG